MKKTTRLLSTLLVGTLLSFRLQPSAQAQILSYTNTADAWLTPASWTPANDWGVGAVRTNTTTANVRLNVGTVANRVVPTTYDATMGTTILNNAATNLIGFVIGSGNTTTGSVTIAGGALVIRSGNPANGGLLVGAPAAGGAAQGTLTLSGGDLVFTNANGNGFGVMSVAFRGGSPAGGTNFAQGTFTIGGGSTATIERVFFGFTASEAGAQSTGVINLNAGGTLSTRNISGRDGDTNQMASFLNLNGGTLRVLGPNVASLATPFITDAATGTNLTVNVQSGGAVIDTAGFNATSAEPLLDAGGGGGLTKNGAGTLTLNQPNTYTGPTVVNGGGLSFILPSSSSALTLANGATTTITPTNNAWTNIVTSVTNATINLALGTAPTIPNATTAVINTATLNASGVNVINITSALGLSPGILKLIDYSSSANRFGGGSFVLGTLPPGLGATLIDGPNDVSLNVTFSVPSLIWTVGNGDWQTNGLANWNSGSAFYQEYPSGVGDVVNFTDVAGGFYTVNVPGDVKPADVVLNHSTNAAVTLSGVGQITGAYGMTKTGNGTTLMSLSNIFTGAVSVNDGILQVNNGGALGSTAGGTTVAGTGTVLIGDGFNDGTTVTGETITLNGAGLGGSLGALRGSIDPLSANVWAGPIVLAGNNSRIGTDINGNITVAGPITDNGSNYFVLYRPGNGGTITAASSGHSYGGTATFGGSGSVIKLGVNNGFSTNALQAGPGTIDLNGFNQTVSGLFEFGGGTPGVIVNNGGGASTLTINTAGTNIFVATTAIQDGSQPISLFKEGSGLQSLNSTNANTYTGNTAVNNGELRLNSTLGNTAVSVNSGASLTVGSAVTVDGTITVNTGGTLSPGLPFVFGALTNTSTVTLNAGSTSLFHVDAGTNVNDRLVANNISYGGTLVVTNRGATAVTNGQVFQLVGATTPTGNFANAASVVILPVGTGTFNPATGELTVTAIPPTIPTTPTNITFTATGSNLTITWPTNYLGWSLQTQTNTRSIGLRTATNFWFTIPGTESATTTNLPVDKINETVFFRLFYTAP